MNEKRNNGYPSDAYNSKIAQMVAAIKEEAKRNPEAAKEEARMSLEKMGVMQNGVMKEHIVSWN